jgi:hypothetical protein
MAKKAKWNLECDSDDSESKSTANLLVSKEICEQKHHPPYFKQL